MFHATTSRIAAATATPALVAVGLSACTQNHSSSGQSEGEAGPSITVLSHDSFDFPQELLDQFKADTGITVTIQPMGDGGTVANQLVLTKDAPLGDVVYGLDNTVSYRILGEGVIQDVGIASPNSELDFAGEPGLIPIDMGDVCINVDKTWFSENSLAQPQTLEDLLKPEYKGLLVAMNPASSTPGMAFMLATIEHFGEEGWLQYWTGLTDNGVKITEGWSDAFSVDYSAGEGQGPYPMMVSYGSSPAYSVAEDGSDTTTASLDQTCYRQVEYAGVLTGTAQAQAAGQFVEYLLTPPVQAAISQATYMFPTNPEAQAPQGLVTFGSLSPQPRLLPADEVGRKAQVWLRQWQDDVIG